HRPGPALEAAAKRARALDAELLGLFIEDVELLRFAAMPFACEIGTFSGRRHAVDAETMQRYMAERAAELQAALRAAATRSAGRGSFRVTRSTVWGGLLEAAAEEREAALLLPPGVDVDVEPRILTRAQFAEALRPRVRVVHPILLL